jgi:hypothetical protein
LKRFQVKELFWDEETGGATKEALTGLWDLINKDRADKLQGSKWKIDDLTIKYENKKLAESIGGEAAEKFWLYDDGTINFLSRFKSKYLIGDQSPLFKFRKILRKKPTYNVQTVMDRLEIIKRTKWKNINAKRVRLKIKKLVKPFLENIEKKFRSTLPFRRDKAQKFHDSLLPLAREINRSIFIRKSIGADLQKDNVYEYVEKRTRLGARFNCQTECIQDIIIGYCYNQIPNDFLCSVEDKKDCSCTVGDVLIKAV